MFYISEIESYASCTDKEAEAWGREILAPVSVADRVYIKFTVHIGRFGPQTNAKWDRICDNRCKLRQQTKTHGSYFRRGLNSGKSKQCSFCHIPNLVKSQGQQITFPQGP